MRYVNIGAGICTVIYTSQLFVVAPPNILTHTKIVECVRT